MGSSKRRSRSGQRRATKVKSRRQRLAEEEATRERHTRLVAERADDPRFVQQETFPGGRRIRWDPESPIGTKLTEVFKKQMADFRVKFGRDLGPEDPIFFDPDADEPTPLTEKAWDNALDDLITNADQLGIDPAYLQAGLELGYLITEQNQHLFSAAEVQTFFDAVEKHQDDDDQNDDGDIDISDIMDLLADHMEAAVQETLRQQSPEPARLLTTTLAEADIAVADLEDYDAEEEGSLIVSIAFAVLAAWAVGAREELDTADLADTVLTWIATHLSEPCAALARRAAGILGSDDAPDLTINELAHELGPNFIPVMVWLATGLVAQHGSGDTAWLRRYDVHSNKD